MRRSAAGLGAFAAAALLVSVAHGAMAAGDGETPAGSADAQPLVSPEEAAQVGLEDRLCLALYTASRAMTARYRVALEEFGLTYPQYLVLVVLWHGHALTIKDLATRLRLDHGTLTPLLRRMERAGLLTRSRNTADERTVTVTATEEGLALREHEVRIQSAIRSATGLGGAQIADLQTALRSMTAHLSG